MKVSTSGGKPLTSGGKVVTTSGGPCACGDCGGAGTTGACCIDGECSILSATDCATAGGIYKGDGTLCSPNPCCTNCSCFLVANPPFEDAGICYTIQECDLTFSNPVPCDTFWNTFTQTCCCGEVPPDCSCGDPTSCFTMLNGITCEITDTCSHDPPDCGTCSQTNVLSDQCFDCP